MAKWGEGDPRWIVEERPDATNVNNWHWTEKNASQWSKDKLKELFTNLKVEDERGYCNITEVSKCEGEAVANNRKAKLIFFYEWVLTLKWKGRVKGSDTEVSGKVEIPNLSEEHEPKDVDITVTIKEATDEAEMLKEMMRSTGANVIREKLGEYIARLREEFSQGMILPTKDPSQPAVKPMADKTTFNKGNTMMNGSNDVKTGVKLETGVLTMTESFKCTAEDFYKAFTQIELVQAFTQGPCKIELKKGGNFELLGGNIKGNFVELKPYKKIVQNWRFRTWPEGHHSLVEMEITQKEDSTMVHLKQTHIPLNEVERTKEGWRRYYWDSMKRTFGFGSILF